MSKVKHEMSTEIAFYWHFMMERGAILISYTRLYFKARSVWQDVPWSLLCLQFIAGPMWSRVTRKLR